MLLKEGELRLRKAMEYLTLLFLPRFFKDEISELTSLSRLDGNLNSTETERLIQFESINKTGFLTYLTNVVL
jgi:hypothetical protein